MVSSAIARRFGLTGNRGCKAPVRSATTANITLSGEQTIGGVALVDGDRCLVWHQTTATQNGIYDVSTGSWTRSIDADGTQDWSNGTIGIIAEGTYADQFWINTTADPIVPDTSNMTFLVGVPSLPVLAASGGADLVGYSDGTSGAVTTTVQRKLRVEDCCIFDFLTAAQQADVQAFAYAGDYTTQEAAAYAAADSNHRRLIYPGGGYRFTGNKVWNKSVDVIGKNSEFVIMKKDVAGGDFIGITISAAAQQSEFSNFRLTTTGTVSTSEGIKILASARMRMHRIAIDRQGGHGLSLYDSGVNGNGVFSRFSDLTLNLNGGDGLRIEKFYASYFENLNLSQNTGWGFNVIEGNSHIGKAILCENNIAGGAQIGLCVANSFEIYGEGNTGTDLSITSSATRTKVFMYHSGGVSDVSDEGVNSIVEDIGTFPMISSPNIGRIPRTTNVAGRPMLVKAGLAGPGAAGHVGGLLTNSGGDAAGGTIAKGGGILSQGGQGIHGGDGGDNTIVGGTPDGAGDYGSVVITNAHEIIIDSGTNAKYLSLQGSGGAVRIGGSNASGASVGLDMQGILKVFKFNSLATANRDALTVGGGLGIYNQTTGKLNFYSTVSGIWEQVAST